MESMLTHCCIYKMKLASKRTHFRLPPFAFPLCIKLVSKRTHFRLLPSAFYFLHLKNAICSAIFLWPPAHHNG
jgi:hypothetical protein